MILQPVDSIAVNVECRHSPPTQGYLAHKKLRPPLGSPQGPGHSPTVFPHGEVVSYERGTPVETRRLWGIGAASPISKTKAQIPQQRVFKLDTYRDETAGVSSTSSTQGICIARTVFDPAKYSCVCGATRPDFTPLRSWAQDSAIS